jgi:hypothetical protein
MRALKPIHSFGAAGCGSLRWDRRWFGNYGTARNLPCPSALISVPCSSYYGISHGDDPEKTLQELRQRIATEGLPKLSAEALRSYKCERWRRLSWASRLPLNLCSVCPQKRSDCSERKLILHGHGSGGNRLICRHAVYETEPCTLFAFPTYRSACLFRLAIAATPQRLPSEN